MQSICKRRDMQEEGYAYTFPAPTIFFDEFVRNTPATN